MSAVFSSPRWLRDLGVAAWLLVGVAALLVGLTWIAGMTSTIMEPVLVGLVVATVASPLVSLLQRHRVPRAAGAGLVLLLLIALGAVIVLLVVGGVRGEAGTIKTQANAASDKFQGWLEDVGVNDSGASAASDNAKASVPDVISTFVNGVAKGISGLTSLAFFLAFTIFSLFMLLKDGPKLRLWIDRHLGVPPTVAQTITGNVVLSIRRYFLGTTIVATFNAIVVGVGAWILGVPLAGTIAVVTLVTAYIPFVGAFVSGRVRGRARARLGRDTDRADHARDRHPRERRAPEHRPADRDGRDAEDEPAADPRRDDQRRRVLRHGRDDPRRSADLGRDPHLARPLARPRRRRKRPSKRPSPLLPSGSRVGCARADGLARSPDPGCREVRRARSGRDSLL